MITVTTIFKLPSGQLIQFDKDVDDQDTEIGEAFNDACNKMIELYNISYSEVLALFYDGRYSPI